MWNASKKILINNIIFLIVLGMFFMINFVPITLIGMPGGGSSFDICDYFTYIFDFKFIIKGIAFCLQNTELFVLICIGVILPLFSYVFLPLLYLIKLKIDVGIIMFLDILIFIGSCFFTSIGITIFVFPAKIINIFIFISIWLYRIYQYKKRLIFID